MKTFGLAAIILVLAGASFVFAQEVPKPAPVVEPPQRPRSILPPQTPAEKMMRQFRQMNANSLPVDIFSPLPRDPHIDATEAAPTSSEPVKLSN
jgi:hypothetical protein